MAQRETSDQAEKRFLDIYADTIERLEKNEKFKELEYEHQELLIKLLLPTMFYPKDEIKECLKNIQNSKTAIAIYNQLSRDNTEHSELLSSLTKSEVKIIQEEFEKIKRIRGGEFEWLT